MDTDVTVVGAGPTALVAAGELARRGRRVRVLDAAATPFPGSRGKGLQPRTLEVLDPLGVADRLVSLGRFQLPIRHHEADGTWTDNDLHPDTEAAPDRPWVRSLIIPQWRTEEVLRDRLAELGVAVEQDARLVDLSQDADGVTAVLEDGREVRSRWLIGADGGASTVRHRVGATFLGETDETTRLLSADVEVDGLDRDRWHMWQNAHGFVALCPLPGTPTWALQLASTDPAATPDEPTLRAALDGLTPRLRLRRIGWSSVWRLNVRMVDRYRFGRVFLAGDAAHVHSPAGGQGANTGMQDAVNLGWKLAAVLDGANEALLDTYEAERLPVAADVLGLSSQLTGYGFWQRPGGLARRTLQLDLSYRPADDEAPGLRPGDRAPDAPLRAPDGTATTLFLLRRRADWTVLAVDGGAEPVEGAQVLDVDTLDVDGHLRATYAPEPGERILLRPDGYLAWRGTDPGGAAAFLRAVQVNGAASAGQVASAAGSTAGSSR